MRKHLGAFVVLLKSDALLSADAYCNYELSNDSESVVMGISHRKNFEAVESSRDERMHL